MSAINSPKGPDDTLKPFSEWGNRLSPDLTNDPRAIPMRSVTLPSSPAARTSAAMRASMTLLPVPEEPVPAPLSSSAASVGRKTAPPLVREDTTLRPFDVWKRKLAPDQDEDAPNSRIGTPSQAHSNVRFQPDPETPDATSVQPHHFIFNPEGHSGWKHKLYKLVTYLLVVNGTMSKWSHFLGRKYIDTKIVGGWYGWLMYLTFWVLVFADSTLRGISQSVLANNPVAGILIIVASLQYSRWHFVLSFTGVFTATLMAVLLGVNRGPIRNGLFGYPGFLLGCAAAVMIDDQWNYKVFLCVAFLAAISTVLNVTLGNWLVPKYRLPPLTVSFVICAMTLLGCVQVATNLAVVSVGPPGLPPAAQFDPQLHINGSLVYQSWIRGVSQMCLLSDPVSGWLMIGAMMFYSRISAGAAAMGSLLGALLSIYIGIDSTSAIRSGLWGFVPALTAIALCGLFYALTATTVVLSILACLFSVLLSVPMRMAGGVIGLPVFSLPFIVTTWLFLGAQGSIKHAPAVDLTEISTPERHLVDLWKAEKDKKNQSQ